MTANPNFEYLHDRMLHDRMVLLQGGTRSGKTRSCIDYVINICVKYSGMEIDICRDTFVSLRSTVYVEFVKALRSTRIPFEWNKSEHIITIRTNNVSFYGLDNDEKIHGRERDIIWINEINQIKETVYDQIAPRTRHRIIGDFNPRLGREHWLDTYIDKYPPMITTYRDNPFLTAAQITDIESKRGNKYWWSIYGKGERAAVEGVIFDNWEVGEFDTTLPYCYGLDWGYYPDPLAMVKIAIDKKKKTIYLDEIIYGKEIKNVSEAINSANVNKHDLIVCDTSEPRAREAIKSAGYNIVNAVKNKIIEDIRVISNYNIIVTNSSRNLKKELDNYSWNDKRSSVPIDDWNHGLDAMRYGFNRLVSKSILGGVRYYENIV